MASCKVIVTEVVAALIQSHLFIRMFLLRHFLRKRPGPTLKCLLKAQLQLRFRIGKEKGPDVALIAEGLASTQVFTHQSTKSGEFQ